MTEVRKFVNDVFRGKDSFQVVAITTGAILVCGGVAYTVRAIADGSAQKTFYRFLFSAVKNAPGRGSFFFFAYVYEYVYVYVYVSMIINNIIFKK